MTGQPGTHDESKPSVIEARWSADRIGPTTMAAPQRGQVHVAVVSVVVADAVASVDGWGIDGLAKRVRASKTRAARQVFARNPDCRMRTKPPRQDVLDEAAQKLHGAQRHGAVLVAVGIVLPLEGDVVAIESEQP